MFTPKLAGWRAQYERTLRGAARLRQPNWSSVECQDDLQHFLQDCWHLKDWIKNDPAISFAGRLAVVHDVGFYHGGDPLYVLIDIPGVRY